MVSRKLSVFMFVIWLLVLTQNALAVDIKVSVDSDEIALNDSFTIYFQSGGSVDGDPDFSPLEKDFKIIGNQQRNNLTIINGKRSSSTEWLVEVMALRVGKLTIPEISFGKDKSTALQVMVKNAPAATDDADQEIFIEVEVTPEETWVQAQVIYTIRLFRSVNTFNSSLSEPKISDGKMLVEKLEDRQFETSRNNRRYTVLQRRYALFPQSSGKFTIDPIIFQAQISQQSRYLFDPFGRNNLSIQRFSPPVTVNIKAVPADFPTATWLPAEQVEVHEKWLKDDLQLIAGEPVTRTIVIKAEGLMAEQIPEIGTADLESFRLYPDQPELTNQHALNGILGIRQEKSAVIANEAGEFVLPAVTIPWWNTQTGKTEIARLPERVITVLADPNSKPTESPAAEATEAGLPVSSEITDQKSVYFWPWIAFLLGLGWLSTLFLWWRQDRHRTSSAQKPPEKLTERQSLRSLREAVRGGDPVQIKTALLIWGKAVWPDQPPISLSDLGHRCGEQARQEVEALNQSLYGNTENKWNGERLLLAIENFDGLKSSQESSASDGLEPLYKIT